MSTEYKWRADDQDYDPHEKLRGTSINSYQSEMLGRITYNIDHAVTGDERQVAESLTKDLRDEAREKRGLEGNTLTDREHTDLEKRLDMLQEQYTQGKLDPENPRTQEWERRQWKSALDLMEKVNPEYGEQWLKGMRENMGHGESYDIYDNSRENMKINGYQAGMLERVAYNTEHAVTGDERSIAQQLTNDLREHARERRGMEGNTLTSREQHQLDHRLQLLNEQYALGKFDPENPATQDWERHQWRAVLDLMERVHPDYGEPWLRTMRENMGPGATQDTAEYRADDREILGTEMTRYQMQALGALVDKNIINDDPFTNHHLSDLAFNMRGEAREAALNNPDAISSQEFARLDRRLTELHRMHERDVGNEGTWEDRRQEAETWKEVLETMAEIKPEYQQSWAADLRKDLDVQDEGHLPDWTRNAIEAISGWKQALIGRNEALLDLPADPEDNPIGDTAITLWNVVALESMTDSPDDQDWNAIKGTLNPLAERLRDRYTGMNHQMGNFDSIQTMNSESALENITSTYRENIQDPGYQMAAWAYVLQEAADNLDEYDLPWVRALSEKLTRAGQQAEQRELAGQLQ